MNFTWILGLIVIAIIAFIGYAVYKRYKAPQGS